MSYTYGQQIWNGLLADIQNELGVAGLMGNLVAESGLIPYRVQGDFSNGYADSITYTSNVDSGSISENDFVNNGPGGGGYGLAQWTFPPRKQALYNMSKSMGVSIGSVELAVAYLLYELKNDYIGTYNAVKTATSIRECSDYVLHNFENPADQSEIVEIKRANLGIEIYNLYNGSAGTIFTPRLTEPTTDNKYYLRPSVGGVNECIEIANGSVLPNCVGYAWGRAYEIMGSKPALSMGDAEVWYGYLDGYSRGQIPQLGSIICWSKGVVGDDSDGSGHVAVVEEILSDGTITTSNSAYGGTRYYTQTITPVNGKYLMSGYNFQGFIYLPISYIIPPIIPPVTPSTRKRTGYNFMLFGKRKRVF